MLRPGHSGIGGWRITSPDDDDKTWTNLNSRLELPTAAQTRQRNHFRSNTSGSLTTVSLPLKFPALPRPASTRAAGSTSSEEYLPSCPPSKSTTALDDANIGKALLRRKSSSGSSHSSARTLSLTVSNK